MIEKSLSPAPPPASGDDQRAARQHLGTGTAIDALTAVQEALVATCESSLQQRQHLPLLGIYSE